MINPSVCLSVCVCLSVREHISGTALLICTKFCVQIPCGRGSILLRCWCTTLCTVLPVLWIMSCLAVMGMTPKRGVHRAATAMSGVAIPGRSLMSMSACLVLKLSSKTTVQYCFSGTATFSLSIFTCSINVVCGLSCLLHCEPIKNTPKCFCCVFYKSQSMLIKFGVNCPE